MRSKTYISAQANGGEVTVLNEAKSNKRLDESLLQLEKENTFTEPVLDEDWLEVEEAKREKPHIERMAKALKENIQDNEDFLLTYSSDLLREISEEVIRLSRDEPGGVKACRVHLNLVSKDCCTDSDLEEFLKSKKEIPLTRLGSANIAETRVIETSVVDVYLFSSCSFFSRLQGIVTSLTRRNKTRNHCSSRASLLPEFVLVKRKLFRSRNSDPSVFIKSVPA